MDKEKSRLAGLNFVIGIIAGAEGYAFTMAMLFEKLDVNLAFPAALTSIAVAFISISRFRHLRSKARSAES